jgi:hypothetical protein
LNEDLNQNIVPFGTSFCLAVIVALNPPITNRKTFCDGRCLLDDYHGISSLGEPKFLTIYDEIHNKSFLMQRIYNLRQFYPDDHHSPNISFNIMMFYSSAFQNPV